MRGVWGHEIARKQMLLSRISWIQNIAKKKPWRVLLELVEDGVLASCVGCLCVLFRLFSTVSAQAASHGGDLDDDSWLKWHSTLLTVLRHSRISCRCFSSMIQILSFVIFTRMSHVSQCTTGSAPIRESCTDFSSLQRPGHTGQKALATKKTCTDFSSLINR